MAKEKGRKNGGPPVATSIGEIDSPLDKPFIPGDTFGDKLLD